MNFVLWVFSVVGLFFVERNYGGQNTAQIKAANYYLVRLVGWLYV